MNEGVKHRLNAIGDCSNGIGQAVGQFIYNVVRFPFAIVFGWADPVAQAVEAQRLLAMQMQDLEKKAEAKAREASPEPSDN